MKNFAIELSTSFEDYEIIDFMFFYNFLDTMPKEQKSKGQIDELKFSRAIKILLSINKGKTYVARREDGGKLFTHGLKETNAINWQDGQQINFKVPGRYKGKIKITVKGDEKGRLTETINIGALDAKIYKANQIPDEIKIIKQSLVKEAKHTAKEYNNNEYVQYCIDMGYTGVNKEFSLEDLKDPNKCTEKELK